MRYEVESKFYVDDLDAVLQAIRASGAEPLDVQHQSDTYYTHPCRDFGVTDEALRLRCVADRRVLTYKGPKIDATSKTRREIELPLAADDAHVASAAESTESEKATAHDIATTCAEWLDALGFRPLRTLSKRRQRFRLVRDDREFELDIDRVDGIGAFLEVETVSEEADLDAARASLARLVAELGVFREERRSYLELLLEQERSPEPPPA